MPKLFPGILIILRRSEGFLLNNNRGLLACTCPFDLDNRELSHHSVLICNGDNAFSQVLKYYCAPICARGRRLDLGGQSRSHASPIHLPTVTVQRARFIHIPTPTCNISTIHHVQSIGRFWQVGNIVTVLDCTVHWKVEWIISCKPLKLEKGTSDCRTQS